MLAEAVHKIGADAITKYVDAHLRTLGWPMPPNWREIVARDVASLVSHFRVYVPHS